MIPEPWYYVLATIAVLLATYAASYAILVKDDPRAALGWVALICLAPIIGPVVFFWLGVNRIERKANRRRVFDSLAELAERVETDFAADTESLGDGLDSLRHLVNRVTKRTLLAGNLVEPLRCGDEAYPRMLRSIDEAERSVTLSTYIFDVDAAGRRFIDALRKAVERGVEVRVLVDDVGSRYSRPRCIPLLLEAGVPVDSFMPTLKPRWLHGANLRSHRKILVVDGLHGYTGGMNIRRGHVLADPGDEPVRDLHFRVEGPIVTHLQAVFASDWNFANGELLRGETWFREPERCGPTLARGVPDGPDEDFDAIERVLLGALASARKSVVVITPYFLPESPLVNALITAAMRGVQVDVVLPEKGNLRFVQWASNKVQPPVIKGGCRLWWSAPPFDHTKLMLVDDVWSFFGSANWDPRSLRLNFEFNLECYDRDLASRLREIADERLAASRRISVEELEARNVLLRLRDGVVHLAAPYL